MDKKDFEKAAGEFLGGDSSGVDRLLEHLENDRDKRRDFFQALDAQVDLEQMKRAGESVRVAPAPSGKFAWKKRVLLPLAAVAAAMVLAVGAILRFQSAEDRSVRLVAALNQCSFSPAKSPDASASASEIRGQAVHARARAFSICETALGGDNPVRMRVLGGSRVRVEPVRGGWDLVLREGTILIHVPPGGKAGRVQVRAGRARVLITGTSVAVHTNKAGTRVRLWKGKVRVEVSGSGAGARAGTREMRAGEIIEIGKEPAEPRRMAARENESLAKSFASMERVARDGGKSAFVRRELLRAAASSNRGLWKAQLRLRDGRVLRGYARRTLTHYILHQENGKKISLPQNDIVEMEILFNDEPGT